MLFAENTENPKSIGKAQSFVAGKTVQMLEWIDMISTRKSEKVG